ncbi:ABC transporter substrate-binding protein [Bradyrhizobium sp. KBS0727]|uniref:ABC transporter substrate-binding protein n=1 Tax=unclassified Bradyrhizobium TaxID=2631580 RepID=UPI00110EF31C|nr:MULTISPECIES: ABC transporter substrate-binding protein [unclassified Bradyrhizobium]QDW37253.1 ABC transporter substrate-binding protein [Bradyrhizobium sp. KBS0725]QDW43856.1 ABC transporter substrate-binding protein [Bradyrhizobium sp. KBS0727]
MRTTSLILGLVTALNASTALHAQEVTWRTQGVTKDEVVLGMHADLSGVAASFSVGVVNAIRMRIDEVNETGGINGRKLRLVVEDTGYQVPKAVQAANKLINRDGVFAMIGNLGTPQNNAVLPEQLKAGVPNIFPISWADSMSKPFHPLKFAIYAPYSDQIRVAVKYMVEKKGKKTVCAMHQDTDFGSEVFNGAKAELDAMGMKFAEVTTHKPTDQDFTAQLTKLRAANCDLIAMGTIVRDTVIPYSAARKMGWDVDMIGTSASYDLAISGVQGGTTEGYYTAGFFDAPYPESARPAAAAWITRYKSRYNIDPTIQAALGQVIIDLTVKAIENAGPDLTTQKLVEGMEKIRNYQDIFGGPPQGFSTTEHVSSHEAVIYRVEKGRWARLPDSVAVAK